MRVLAEQLVVGDVILLEEGDRISADCVLIEASGLELTIGTYIVRFVHRPIYSHWRISTSQ